jgi:4-hydroxy-tetrahydrodipicolinate synthase
MKKEKFEGIIPAMVTPFTEKGEVNFTGIKENVDFLIENGVSQILCLGGTGEVAALTREECIRIIETTVKATNGRIPVIAGTGAPSTMEVIERTKEAISAGADSVLIVTPFYEIPTQDGLYKHYATIAETVNIPIILYNIPPNTQVEIEPQTLLKLAEIDNIVALKESSGNVSYFAEVMRLVGDKIAIFNGGDDISLPCFTLGCPGAVLALGNIAPRMLVDMYTAVQKKEMKKASNLFFQLLPISRIISVAQNFPAPVKEAVHMLGRPAGPPRSPIMQVSQQEKEVIRAALEKACLI